MSIATAIDDLKDRIEDAYDALEAKGATIPATKNTYNLPNTIDTISGGGSKYGVPIDGLLGDVDQNGVLEAPSETFSFASNAIRTLDQYALQYKFNGSNITSLSLPNLTQINQYAMQHICDSCSNLTSVNLPSMSTVGNYGMYYAFNGCTSLTSVDLSSLSSVTGTNAMSYFFSNCTALQEVKFNNATDVPAIASNTFLNTNSTFKIIVPNALYEQWRTATNWSAYASQIEKVYPGVEFKAL